MSQEVFTLGCEIPAVAAGTAFMFQAPSSTTGGGITVVDASWIQVTAGTVPNTLIKYSSAGTPAVNGTIGTSSGTIVAKAPLAYTMGPNNYLQAGEWAAVVTTSGTPAADARLVVHYQMGRQNV